MSDILQEYKDYYNVRAKRYEGDPDYPKSYEAEKALADAMNSCSELSEFKDKLGNLNELSAVARILDTSLMEQKHFNELKEYVRELGPKRILEKCQGQQGVTEAITTVQEESNKNSVEISMDEIQREFGDWFIFESYEVSSRAIVPSAYQQEHKNDAEAAKKELLKRYEALEADMQPWEDGWRMNPDINYEDRHFRLLPYPKESIDNRRAQAKDWTGR